MKSYSLELVQRKTGSGTVGKLASLALIGAGLYYGYKALTSDKKNSGSGVDKTYDTEAHQGEDFTARILRAAKRVVSK